MLKTCLSVMLTAFAAVTFGAEEVKVPAVVVERHLKNDDHLTRVTLFDNRMAVTTVCEGDKQVFFRQITLPGYEYRVYLTLFEGVATTAGSEAHQRLNGDEMDATVVISPPGHEPRSFRYSPMQVLDLDTSRLVSALDDLQLRVSEVSPSQEALRNWQPMIGQRVILFIGTSATVTDILDEGMIRLEHDTTGIIELVPEDKRHLVIMEVVEEPS